MSKPAWKDAPEWANYLTMDVGGRWFWHEKVPYLDKYVESYTDSYGKIKRAYVNAPTLEKRP